MKNLIHSILLFFKTIGIFYIVKLFFVSKNNKSLVSFSFHAGEIEYFNRAIIASAQIFFYEKKYLDNDSNGTSLRKRSISVEKFSILIRALKISIFFRDKFYQAHVLIYASQQ